LGGEEMKKLKPTLTREEWNALLPHVKDISKELPASFLMVGQVFAGRILYDGVKYDVTAWNNLVDPPYVMTKAVKQ
jgi:hypothetical protein